MSSVVQRGQVNQEQGPSDGHESPDAGWNRPDTRILHLIASGFVGGPEKQILSHAVRARELGCDVSVGAFRETDASPEILQRATELGIPALELGRSSGFLPATIFELKRILKEQKFSLLVTYGYKADLIGWSACSMTDCRQLAFVRGWTAQDWKVRQYERTDRILLRRMKNVACVSKAQVQVLGGTSNTKPPMWVIPNAALDMGLVSGQILDRAALRETLGLPANSFIVGTVGRLSPEKGQRFLLESIPQVANKIQDLMVVVLGEGSEGNSLQEQCQQLGIVDRVLFAGFRKDVRQWMQTFDVLVNPSLTEGVPNAVLEAMVAGVPVIATSVGGVPDLIQEGDSGLLVPAAQPSAIAEAVLKIHADPLTRSRLVKGGLERASKFSPEEQCQKLFAVYREILGPASANS